MANIPKKFDKRSQELIKETLCEIIKSKRNFKQFDAQRELWRDLLSWKYCSNIPSFLLPPSVDSKMYKLLIVKYMIIPPYYKFHITIALKYNNVSGIKRLDLTSMQILNLFILYSFHKNCKFVRYLSKYPIAYSWYGDGIYQVATGVHVRYNLGLNGLIFRAKYINGSISLFDAKTNEITILSDFELAHDGSWYYITKIPKRIKFERYLINKIINTITTKNSDSERTRGPFREPLSKLIHYYSRYPF